ncbi:MAG: response regulator transcription factor [Solirubrobacterales bacterium]|nr:response regulator transcription factor [Solirubrobacterales bacterium]
MFEAGQVGERQPDPNGTIIDLAIFDVGAGDVTGIVLRLRALGCNRVLALATHWQSDEALEAIRAGASGVLSKSGMTSQALLAQVQAALHGAGVVPPELLGSVAGLAPRESLFGGLTEREQTVLRLYSEGKVTRKVASELSYSERTIKNVLHDAVMKLGARSRSQAIACATREGLI